MKNQQGESQVPEIIAHKNEKKFSLYIIESIIMPQNFRSGNDIHIGVTDDGIFNVDSEDVYLVAQIKDNIFRAAIGDKTMYCILLSDEETKLVEQGIAHFEDYEAAAKIRDTKNVFIYRDNLSDLLGHFGLGFEDCKFLFNIRVSQDYKSGYTNFNLSGDTLVRIDSFELWNVLSKYALEMAHKGDSGSIEELTENLTSLNKLGNEVLSYLLFLKGLALEAKGHKQEAKEIYAEAIKIEPSVEKYIEEQGFNELSENEKE